MNIAIARKDRKTVFVLLQYARLVDDEVENGLAFIMKEFVFHRDLDNLIKCYDNSSHNFTKPSRIKTFLSRCCSGDKKKTTRKSSPFASFISHCADKHLTNCPAKVKQAIRKFKANRTFDINYPKSNLALAIEKCSIEFCEALLQEGADVNSSFPGGKRAIHVAIEINSPEKVQLLLEYNADLHSPWKKQVLVISRWLFLLRCLLTQAKNIC